MPSIYKLLLSAFLLSFFSHSTFAQESSANNAMLYEQFTKEVKIHAEYCRVEGGVLGPEHRDAVGDCNMRCRVYGMNLQTAMTTKSLSQEEYEEGVQRALSRCVSASAEVERLVNEVQAVNPSISEKFGLGEKHRNYKSQIDRGYNQCIEYSSNPKGHTKEECLCTAKKVVNSINEHGSYSRVFVAFVRLVQGCRNK